MFLLAISPIFLFPPLGRHIMIAIVLLPLVWACAVMTTRQAIPATPFDGTLALILIMVLVSLWATYDVSFSAGKVLGVVFGIAFYFAIVRHLSSASALKTALNVFVLAGVGVALVGILGTNWIWKVSLIGSITAHLPALIRGIPGQAEGFQPNAIAGALVMFVPLQIALVMTNRGLDRLLHCGALAFTGGTVVLTQSRNGWLSLGVALFVWMLWYGRRSRGIAIALIAIGLVTAAFFLSRIESLVGGGLRDDLAGRLKLWSRAIDAIADFPLTGMGMNTFRRVMPVLYPAFSTSSDADVAHAHNHFLQAALDLGIPGLIAYLAIWLGIADLLMAAERRATDRGGRLIASGFGAGMLAYFLFGTADAIALGAKLGIFFWIALALITAMHKVVKPA